MPVRAATVHRPTRVLLVALLLASALTGLASALTSSDLYVPTDGTFRDARALSRIERAMLLTQRLSTVGADAPELARAQARDLSPELSALGFDASLLTAPPAEWRAIPPRVAWDDAEWGRPSTHDWTLTRMRGVDAFWTDPTSPALRDAVAAETSGRPRISPPRGDRPSFLSAWMPPPPEQDFTLSSPASVLPADARIALGGGLSLDFAFAPHRPASEFELPKVVDTGSPMATLPASSTTLDALARVGLSPADVGDGSPLVSNPSLKLQTPILHAETAPAEGKGAIPRASMSPPSPVRLTLDGGYENRSLLGETLPDGGLFSSEDARPLLAPTTTTRWTHLSANAGYRLPLRNVNLNLKLDEWTFGEALTGGGRGLGLDHLRVQDARLNVNVNVNPNLSLQGGYIYTRSSGAAAASLESGLNVIQDRAYPYLGVDYKISTDARWKVNIRFYNTPFDLSTTGQPRNGLNLNDPQVTTEVKVRF